MKEKASHVGTLPKEHNVHCKPRGSGMLMMGEVRGSVSAGGGLFLLTFPFLDSKVSWAGLQVTTIEASFSSRAAQTC